MPHRPGLVIVGVGEFGVENRFPTFVFHALRAFSAAAALALLLPKMAKIPVFHRKRKVDWLGGVLLMASAVVFMLVLTWGGTRFPWLSPTVLAMVGGAVALAVTFVWHVRRTAEPFLPLGLMAGSVAKPIRLGR